MQEQSTKSAENHFVKQFCGEQLVNTGLFSTDRRSSTLRLKGRFCHFT